jgi:NitT/TauT family transport system substrate-binding protein
MSLLQSRREFAATMSATGAAMLLGGDPVRADEAAPETTTVRLPQIPGICFAPIYVAEDLLRAEGFTDIRFVTSAGGMAEPEMVARGELDVGSSFAGTVVHSLDLGLPITALAGLHVGCYELFVHDPIRTIRDIKGRRVGIQTLKSSSHLYLSIIARNVGLDPQADIDWVDAPSSNAMELFVEGRTDAFLGFPPEPQELRARGAGRMILSTATDRPWSQYICCVLYSNADWVRDHPIAAKRLIRGILKAAEYCAAKPEAAARRLVEGGFTRRYDYAVQTVRDIPYLAWRDYDAEDSMRFYALALHDARMIKADPRQLLANGTDWRFLQQIKRELKT